MKLFRSAQALVHRLGWRGAGALLLGVGGIAGGSVLFGTGSAVGAPTCTINFNKVAGGDFFTAANWNDAVTPTTHRVPGATDYACVLGTTTGAVTFSTGASKTIKGIDAEGTGGFTATSGTLTVSDAVNATTILNLNLSGATIAGAGAVNITGSSSWASGTVSGTGAITVPSGATLSVTSTGCYPLLSKALTNHGTIQIADGGCSGLWMAAGKTLTNASDGTINLQADSATINNFDSSAVSLANSGTITKSVGGGTTVLGVSVTNSGAVVSYQALTGTIALGTSTNSATIGGSGNLDLGTSFTVTGATTISSGPSVQINGTVVDGAANLTFNGAVAWNYGTFQGAGNTTFASSATVTMANANCYPLLMRPLTNHGTITVKNGGCGQFYIGNSTVLTNASDGVIDLQDDNTNIGNWDSSTPAISNSGVIKRSSGTGTATIGVAVTSTSTNGIQAQVGTLSLAVDSTISGSTSATAGATLSLDNSIFTVNGATFGGAGTTRVGGATVNLTGNTTVSSGFDFEGGTIDGAGNLALNGGGTWPYGTMQGVGTTTVGAGATMTLPTTNCYPILLRPLTNHGTITISNGGCTNLYVGGGAVLTNASDGTIDVQGDAGIALWDATTPTITNSGVIKKSSGATTTTIAIAVTSTSANGLQAQSGTLSLTGGGTISGSTSASAGATLSLDTLTWTANGVTFGGAGTTQVANGAQLNLTGTTTFSGALTMAGANISTTGATTVGGTFTFSGGIFDGAGNLALNNGGTWNYGTMQGAGTTTIASGTTITMSTSGCYPVLLRPLTNHGTIAESNAGCGGFYIGANATLTNAADGVIDLQGDGNDINVWDATTPAISNSGVIKKSSGTGTTTIAVALTTTSTNGVQAKTGTLSLGADSTISGSASASAGAILNFASNTFAVNGATFSGAGTTRFQGSTVNLTGSNTVSSVVDIEGGTIDGAGNLALNGGGTWPYGTMQGAGTTTIGAGSSLSVPSSGCYPALLRPLTNHGTITITNGGCGGLYMGAGAVLTNASDGVIDLQGTAGFNSYDSLPATVSNSGVIKHSTGNVTSSIFTPISVTNTATGELRSDAGTFVIDVLTNVSANTLTAGKYTVTGSATLQLPFTGTGKLLTNAATISLQGVSTKLSSPIVANALISVATNSGSLSITNGRLLSTNAASFANSGTMVIGDGVTASTFTVGGPYTQSAGTTTVTASSTLTPTASTATISGGTLNGSGTVSRPVATSGTGAVQNADPAGPLTLASGYSGTGKVKTAITSATAFDKINVTGTGTLTGSTLALSTDAGYVPATGQTFTIVSCTTACTGPFSSVTGATMPDGAFYTVTYNATSVVLTVVRNADVSITNADSADPIKADATTGPDSLLTYTVTVANAGPGPANNVSVTDTLPHHAVATTVPGSCTGAADVKTCALGTIPSGSNVVLTFVVRPETPETITNTASSTSTTPDPSAANNTNIAQSTVVTAQTKTSYVNVDDGAGGVSYDKAKLTLKQGYKVQFNFFGTASHRLLSDEGIIDSGVNAPGSEFAVSITGSGVYSFHDTLAAQVVTVKITVKPTFTGSGSTRTVTWASAAPPAGYVFDVKVKTPTGLVTLFTGTSTTGTVFTATQGPGKYQFQVRLRRTSDNAATGYGKSAQFTV